MVVPRLFIDRTAFRGAGCYSLSGMPDHGCPKQTVLDNPDRAIRSSTGETRPVLWHSQGKPEPGPPRSCNSTPQRFTLGLFRPLSRAPKNPWEFSEEFPRTEGRQALIRCLNRPSAWSFRNPFGMTGGDPKHTRAERVEN